MMITQNKNMQKGISIARRNLNNQEYVRTRREKQTTADRFSKVSKMPKCPVFHKEFGDSANYNILMVNGDEWYEVVPNGFFKHVMNNHKRISKAGPSGSTLMMMNMIFGVLGRYVEQNQRNQKMILLCCIADFVPIFHSLPEVLLIYSREYSRKVGIKNTIEDHYNLNTNPIEWLIKHFELDDTIIGDLSELAVQLLNKIEPK
jgi:hypothetical protein